MSASQTLASELKLNSFKLNSSVAGAFAESQDAISLGATAFASQIPSDESHFINHAHSSCQAHSNPAFTHASACYEYGCWGANQINIPPSVPRRNAWTAEATCADIFTPSHSSDPCSDSSIDELPVSLSDTCGHSLSELSSETSFERPLRCFIARAASSSKAGCLRSPNSPSRGLQVSWKKSPIIGQDILCERYKIPPHMLFYSEANGAAHNRGVTYPLMKCTDETGEYNGLPTPPPDGWDEVRQPFAGANDDWEQGGKVADAPIAHAEQNQWPN